MRIERKSLTTARLTHPIATSGTPGGVPVFFLHGNLATSVYWDDVLKALPHDFYGVAYDQRGFGGAEPAIIDATRGCSDWCDDLIAVADSLGCEKFHLAGHSLGGLVAWTMLAQYPERLLSVILIAPGSPYGFGGCKEDGSMCFPDGAGAGAGLIHPVFADNLRNNVRGDKATPLTAAMTAHALLWRKTPRDSERFIDAMLAVHKGENAWPGDVPVSENWPGFKPGLSGPVNALASVYNQQLVPSLLARKPSIPVLWIRGDADVLVSDNSFSDAGRLGESGLIKDWPGTEVFPPQPMVTQTRRVLDVLKKNGAVVQEIVFEDTGHCPQLEMPGLFSDTLEKWMRKNG
jgi:pimeloyl-ACP methyl ester carboxylesterase